MCSVNIVMEDWESDGIVEQWIRENDDTCMALPAIELNPHLLISKVRKHYMEYLIKMLSVNFENNQKLLNKNGHLPSAIWRCAKMIEMSAAQASMVVQLYRKSITNVVKDLKTNTKKGLLYKKLYECLHNPSENEKKTQATFNKSSDCNCKCSCNQRRKIKKIDSTKSAYERRNNRILNNSNKMSIETQPSVSQTQPEELLTKKLKDFPPKMNENVAMQNPDDLMLQLERLFQGDPNDDDLFDGALCEADNSKVSEDKQTGNIDSQALNVTQKEQTDPQEQKKCLDERLALLSGVLVNNVDTSQDFHNQNKKHRTSKWLCEEYFQKVKFFELLDKIGDVDRNKLARVKEMLIELFGPDSDDEGVISPLEETPDFITSCKERIAPWVVQILTPYYVKGRIRGKALFKSLAKHLIRLIYQCSKYPYEYEVQSFVTDFLNNHTMIRCEADFKDFRIENF